MFMGRKRSELTLKPTLPGNAEFSTIYHILSKVYTDEGGIKVIPWFVRLYIREIIHLLKLVNYLHV